MTRHRRVPRALRPAPRLPAPDDPSPRWREVTLLADVTARDDAYSDRIRCDHPDPATAPGPLARALRERARHSRRRRIVVLCAPSLAAGLRHEGMVEEARIPGYYGGATDCCVLADGSATELADPPGVAEAKALLGADRTPRDPAPERSRRARVDDAPAIAALLTETFDHYPTPSGVPAYIAEAIASGVPFRVVEEGDRLIACASADLVPAARTAELTDCATRPEARGRGLMQSILAGLMQDLRALDYPTAYTLARATVPGVNLAFERLGFSLRGTMARSCRIGTGLEDMNVWSRRL